MVVVASGGFGLKGFDLVAVTGAPQRSAYRSQNEEGVAVFAEKLDDDVGILSVHGFLLGRVTELRQATRGVARRRSDGEATRPPVGDVRTRLDGFSHCRVHL